MMSERMRLNAEAVKDWSAKRLAGFAGIRAPGFSGPIGKDNRIYDRYSTINGFSKIY